MFCFKASFETESLVLRSRYIWERERLKLKNIVSYEKIKTDNILMHLIRLNYFYKNLSSILMQTYRSLFIYLLMLISSWI